MSVLKEKIAEAISKHVSLDDTYTYELTRVKSAFEVGTISLEDFEEWSEKNVDDLAGAIVCALQPQLNDNQKIVLEWLKWSVKEQGNSVIDAVFLLRTGEALDSVLLELNSLNNQQRAEVLAAFAQWGLEQEEHDVKNLCD